MVSCSGIVRGDQWAASPCSRYNLRGILQLVGLLCGVRVLEMEEDRNKPLSDSSRSLLSNCPFAVLISLLISIVLFVWACVLPVYGVVSCGFWCLLGGILMPLYWTPNLFYLSAIVLTFKRRYLGAAILGSIATFWAIHVSSVILSDHNLYRNPPLSAPHFWSASMLVLTVGCFIQWYVSIFKPYLKKVT